MPSISTFENSGPRTSRKGTHMLGVLVHHSCDRPSMVPYNPAHMSQLLAVPTYYVSVTTTTSTTAPTAASTTATTVAISKTARFWTVSSNMSRNIAQVTDGIIGTIPCQVTCLPTVVASLVICTISCKMTLLIAVVAQSQVPRWQWGSSAVSCTMSSFATGVADALIWTVASHVSWFPTIPT